MALRDDLLRKIDKKQAELLDHERAWERQKAATEAYIQALQETVKSLPRDGMETRPDQILRSGGAMAKVRAMILATGRPLHINEILKGLGKTSDKKPRASVSGALGAYVRRGEVFVRTGPNTFGLLELGHSQTPEDAPPAGFGSLDEDDDLAHA